MSDNLNKSKKYKALSLFANVGIAEARMKETNVEVVVANELLNERANFYRDMHLESEMICGDITDEGVYHQVISKSKEKNIDFLIATPPCQGMSIAGQLKENDPRNLLIKFVVKAIIDLKPKHVLIENVVGALKTYILDDGNMIKIVEYIKRELEPLGYFINPIVVDVADYGTPQHRKRALFLISLNKEWIPPIKQKKITVREAIGHLPSLESEESSEIPFHIAKKHNDRHILWMRNTPSGKTAFENKEYFPQKAGGIRISGFSTTYKRISWDKPAPTITMANGSISSQNNVHPGRKLSNGKYSDARVLTLKEIFILTGLPEEWVPPLWASENLIRHVIGEGVPPKMIVAMINTLPT